MKKKSLFCMIGLAVSLLGSVVLAEDTFPVTITDALGNEVTMEAAPEVIVSLSPAATEMVYAVGAGEKLAGRTDYCNYPAEAADVDSIGSYMEPNMELILEKSPDLVLASDYIDDTIREQLETAGAVVCLVSANDIAGIEADITTVGALTGNSETAEELVTVMEEELAVLEEIIGTSEEPISAFVDLGYFYSAGPGSLLDTALSVLDIENVCADADSMWPMLSVEAIIEKNPDLYISFYSSLEDIKATAGLEELECLQEEDGFVYIDGMSEIGDMLQRPGPRFIEGIAALADLVYPELSEEEAA